MAKGDLIGGTLWDQYSRKVADRMNNPRNLGEITTEEADALDADLVVADHGAESCGDAPGGRGEGRQRVQLEHPAEKEHGGGGVEVVGLELEGFA